MKIDLQLIADALGTTKRAVERLASRNVWIFEEEAVRGGRRKVFESENLPADVRRAVERHRTITANGDAARHVTRLIDDVRATEARRKADAQAKGELNLKKLMEERAPSVQARFDGRYAIVKSWEGWFPTVQPMGKKASYWGYADAFNAGETDIAAAVREQFAPLNGRSVQRWVGLYDKQGLTGLIDKWDGKAQKDVNVFTKNPALEKTCIALMIARPHISDKDMTNLLNEASVDGQTGEVLFTPPSYFAVRRFCGAWKKKNAELYTASTNPDEWKNKFMVGFGSYSENVERLNQRWEMDATPADWMLQDEDGLRRYTGSGVVDVYSRRAIYIFAPTPKTETHKLLLRLAILSWGIPEQIVTDNGKDYISKEFVGTLNALEVDHLRTDPFSPWQKPHIERMNQTLLHSILDVYSSFIGHSVAERSAIESRASFAERLYAKDAKLIEVAMPAHLLQERVNQWMAGVYEQRPHDGEGMSGMSPFAKAAAYTGAVRKVSDVRALDVLLAAPVGKDTYTVTKKGLNIGRAQFIAPELGLIVGARVTVKQTEDYGRVIIYHEGKFVCIARCPERTGVSRQEIAVHARQLQRQNIAEQRKAAKQPKLNPDALVSSLLAKKAGDAGKLVAMPGPVKQYTTAALRASGEAARVLDGRVAPTEIPAELQMAMQRRALAADAAKAEAPPAPTKISIIPESPQLRFRKWLELDSLLNEGGTIDDPKLIKWYGAYPQLPEYGPMYKRHLEAIKVASGTQTVATVSVMASTN